MIGARSYLTLLRTYLAPLWGKTLVLLVLLVVGAALTLVSPQIMGAFIDAVFGTSGQQTFGLAALFLTTALINQGITIATTYLGSDIGLRATNQLRADLTMHCLRLDMTFHHQTTPGALIERIDGDVSRLNQFLANFAVLLLRNALLIGGVLFVLWVVDWRAGASIGVLIVLALAGLEYTRRLALPAIQREREASAQLFGLIEERLAGAEDVRANGGVDYAMRRFYEHSRAWSPAFVRSHLLGSSPWPVSRILFALSQVAALGIAAWLVGIGEVSIGVGYTIFRYVELIRWPLLYIGRQVQDLQQAGAALIRIKELLATQPTIHHDGHVQLPARALAVTLDRVTFAYPTSITTPTTDAPRNGYALQDISLHLPAGTVLGLLGRTGSGKTTLARLLLRLYEPQHGAIRLDDIALPDVTHDSLRARVGLVTQDIQLFNVSVRDNLTLFAPGTLDQRLLEALRAVELWEWFQTLPAGLDSVLPAGGGGMSAGQAQLLAFARAWIAAPSLLVLDEASSRLDPATEQRLDHAFDRLLQERTAIIIAHRLATVERANWIMIIEDGRCIEFGARTALAHDPASRFATLLRTGAEEVLA